MPRLSTKQYLQAHDHLFGLWNYDAGLFGLLSSSDQRVLHDFFQLTELLPAFQLLAHRKAISAKQPSLPHRAGKANRRLVLLEPGFNTEQEAYARSRAEIKAARRQGIQVKPAPRPSGGRRRITVRAIVRPKPDYKRLAKAILEVARQQAAQEKAIKNSSTPEV